MYEEEEAEAEEVNFGSCVDVPSNCSQIKFQSKTENKQVPPSTHCTNFHQIRETHKTNFLVSLV